MRSLCTLIFFISVSLAVIFYGCKKCVDPTISFDPASATIDLNPGQIFKVNVIFNGNVRSVSISKSINGSPETNFISTNDIGAKNNTLALADTVPDTTSFASVMTYTITAISDCKTSVAVVQKFTVTVTPSSYPLDPIFYEVADYMHPRIYSRFIIDANINTAWDLENKFAKKTTDANSDIDIIDSTPTMSPFAPNVRWGSRNGTRFVKSPPGFNYDNVSAKSIVDAYNADTPSDLITFVAGDYILVNIKNKNKYAVMYIRNVSDNSSGNNGQYTFFKYMLAQ